MTYPYQPVVFTNITVLTPSVTAGEDVLIYWEYCKFTNAPSTIKGVVVDDYLLSIPEYQSSVPKGCGDAVTRLPTKKHMRGDTYYYRAKSCFEMNKLRTICVPYRTSEFTLT